MKAPQCVAAWLLAVAAISCLPRLVAADAPVLAGVLDRKELRVAMSGDQPPLNAKSRGGTIIGFEADVAQLLATAMNVKLKIVETPFPKLMEALAAGEVDIVMSGMAITPQRTLGVSFVGPYVFSGKSILTKSQTLANAEDASEINVENIRVAALANSTSETFAESSLPKTKLTKTQNYDEAIKLLTDGQVDAVVADVPICLLSVLRYPDQQFATLAQPLTIEPIGAAVSASDPQFQNLLTNYMSALDGMGVLEALREKWFEDSSWLPSLP